MAYSLCPFCGYPIADYDYTHRYRFSNFDVPNALYSDGLKKPFVRTWFIRCSKCNQITILVNLFDDSGETTIPLRPNSFARLFPDYIPQAIIQDYKEACAIVSLSPKASATLSRRCLQGMIRDFWGIQKHRLVDEIDALKDKVPINQWNAIDAVRKIGNIGAHMEKDVNAIIDIEPTEALQLINLIESLLTTWYMARHDEQQLYANISAIEQKKRDVRNG